MSIFNREENYQYTPNQFREEYSAYYADSSPDCQSDSPRDSRRQLIKDLILTIEQKLVTQDKLYILDIGAGKQILEKELSAHPSYTSIDQDKLILVTADIADLQGDDLLAPNIASHTQLSGHQLPFKAGTFDIILSNMAIDFMPKSSFNELSRVLKPDGSVLINFHHPDLIKIAELDFPQLQQKVRSKAKKVKFGQKSAQIEQHRLALKRAQQELQDAIFILNHFPHHIFYSIEEINSFLSPLLIDHEVMVEENTSRGQNGWYSARANPTDD